MRSASSSASPHAIRACSRARASSKTGSAWRTGARSRRLTNSSNICVGSRDRPLEAIARDQRRRRELVTRHRSRGLLPLSGLVSAALPAANRRFGRNNSASLGSGSRLCDPLALRAPVGRMGRAASTDRQSRPDVIRRRLDRALARSHARIALRPHDPGTGEEIDKREIVKGYEYGLSPKGTLLRVATRIGAP
jgi:hypothetical protein